MNMPYVAISSHLLIWIVTNFCHSEIENVLDEELEISGSRNKKRKKLMDDKSKQLKRRKENNKADPPQKGDSSVTTKYFEKNKSLKM